MNACPHRSAFRNGEIVCLDCRSRFVIGANGAGWVEPEPAPVFLYRQKGRKAA